MPTEQTMQKTILVTGSTDGIGLETARMLVSLGHNVLLHGRNPVKLEEVEGKLSALPDGGRVEGYVADLSRMAAVEVLAKTVAEKYTKLDVLINNAGVYNTPDPITPDGLDVRFAVNPRSMLGSKMVKEAYGVAGGDLRIGAEILCRVALADEFAAASGQYFDNDIGQFASPHPDALNAQKIEAIVRVIESVLAKVAKPDKNHF